MRKALVAVYQRVIHASVEKQRLEPAFISFLTSNCFKRSQERLEAAGEYFEVLKSVLVT